MITLKSIRFSMPTSGIVDPYPLIDIITADEKDLIT